MNFNQIKMVYSDVDDTLVELAATNYNEKQCNLIKNIKTNNRKLALISGRDMTTIANLLTNDIDYFIGVNGAFIWDNQNQKYLQQHFADVKQFVPELLASGARFVTVGQSGIFKPQAHSFDQDPFLGVHHHKIKDFDGNLKDDIYLLSYYYLPEEKACKEQVLAKWEQKLQGTNAHITIKWDFGFFIQNSNVSKYNAIIELNNFLNLDACDVMFFGDEANDIPVFENLSNSVCVGKNEQVCQLAPHRAPDIYCAINDLDRSKGRN